MTKGLTIRRALAGVADALASGPFRCFFLWGFPAKSLADFLGTAHAVFHAELLGARVEVGQVVPLAGAPLYRDHQGPLEYHERYPFCRVIRPPTDPELAELVRAHHGIFPAFYAFPTPERERKWPLASGICCRD